MQLAKEEGIVNILQNTLNYVDTRLTDHGKRVSYMVYKMYSALGGYTRTQLRDRVLLAMLHDIGAYKTEEIDQMVRFETEEVWDHSIWGYLFLLHFSPLKDLAPAILHHHSEYARIAKLDPEILRLAQIINMADRADTFALENKAAHSVLLKTYDAARDTRYQSEIVDLFLSVHQEALSQEGIESDAGYYDLLHKTPYSDEMLDSLLLMNVLSIDFRSESTATHTITTGACSRALAGYMRLDADTVEYIATGAMLHDLGKTGIPVEILECPGKLDDEAMDIMRQHVVMTEHILAGNVQEDVLRIAVRHHEKLDGSGYPRGLTQSDLALPDRIVAVADIFSALYEARSYKKAFGKARILDIMDQMARDGLIDSAVTDILCSHYDDIIRIIDQTRNPIQRQFIQLQAEFETLKARYDPTHKPMQRRRHLPGKSAY